MPISEAVRRLRSAPVDRTAVILRTLILVGLVGLWALAVHWRWVDPHFVPSPWSVVTAAVDLVQDPAALEAFRQTGASILAAFVIGCSAGILAACVIAASPLLREALSAPISFVLSTPKSIFLPVFTLIFGLGGASAAAFGAFESFFYVVINVLGGLALVEERHLRVARAFGAKRTHRYVDVILPSALPGIFAALWYGIKHAFLGVMIAQLWASDGGIGPLMRTYSSALRTDYVLAIVLLITLVAVIAGIAWSAAEQRLSRWRGVGLGSVVVAAPA
jgi:ABC-type nitrate/sulfonate/bicarbonate transport system permease component